MTKHDHSLTQTSLLLTRVLIAGIFFWHGIPKGFDIPGGMEKFAGYGLPPILGPITGWVEVIAASFLVLGLFHAAAALLLCAVIIGALFTVQIPGGISAGLERDLLLLVGLFVLAVAGPGRFSLRFGRRPLPS
jgi:putative oxidoreductase